MVKSPFNYVGNKFKYRKHVQDLVGGKHYSKIIDPFMGSGNLLFNTGAKAEQYIGIDSQRLLPKIFSQLKREKTFLSSEMWGIIDTWGNFTEKENYYRFRDLWNTDFKEDNYNRDFILRTILLFKLCSNSMVRYNSKGEFNQGFRGANPDGFFKENTIKQYVKELNELRKFLRKNNFNFYVDDSIKQLSKFPTRESLILLDPPYILKSKGMYGVGTYDEDSENQLLDYILNTENDFILFNYIERDGETHSKLAEVSRHYRVIELSTSTQTGQNRTGTKQVIEVLITNIN